MQVLQPPALAPRLAGVSSLSQDFHPQPAFVSEAINRAHRGAVRSMQRVVEETGTPHPYPDVVDKIVDQLHLGPAMVLTGAGVSTDSGIPDYRGPKGKMNTHRPMTYQEFCHDPAASHRYWARSFIGWRQLDRAVPNRTHYALVELERAGFVRGVLTQNVDGLHAEAGQHNVVALHGNLDTVSCLDCGLREHRDGLDARLEAANPGYLETLLSQVKQVNPDGDVDLPQAAIKQFQMVGCLRCDSARLKPDVVYFGEAVPEARKQQARAMAAESASLIVAGSSLAVMSGYRFVLDMLASGRPVAVINGGPGRADARVDVLWRTQVGPAFDDLLDALGL